MPETPRSSSLQGFLSGELGSHRVATIGLLSITVGALVLGAAYGGWYSSLAFFCAVLLGGAIYWQGNRVHGREVYGNLLIAAFVGPALGLVVVSLTLSLALSISVFDVVWTTAMNVLVNTVAVMFWLFAGAALTLAVSSLGLETTDRRALVVLIGSLAVFVALRYQVSLLWPDSAMLSTAILSDQLTTTLRLYQFLGLVCVVAAIGTLNSLVTSRARVRGLLLALTLAGLFLGAAGVGGVHTDISQSKQAASVAEELRVSAVEVTLSEQTLSFTLELTNPTDTEVRRGGAFAAVRADDRRLVFGPAMESDAPRSLGPGETLTATYRLPLNEEQAENVRAAVSEGSVVIDGRQSFDVVDNEITIEFACRWDGETCEPV